MHETNRKRFSLLVVFSSFSKRSCLPNESSGSKVRMGKEMYLPFQHLQALLPLQGSARFRMSPRAEGWEILCSRNSPGLWKDDIAKIIILYLSPSLYIAIPYLKGVPYILKERVLIAYKAVTGLTQNWNLDLLHCQLTTNFFSSFTLLKPAFFRSCKSHHSES